VTRDPSEGPARRRLVAVAVSLALVLLVLVLASGGSSRSGCAIGALRAVCRWHGAGGSSCSGSLTITERGTGAGAARITAVPCQSRWRGIWRPDRTLIGFNTYTSAQTIRAQRQVGARGSRMLVPWSLVEPQPGVWDWAPFEREYRQLLAGGLRPELAPFGSPCWARPSMMCDNAEYTGPPDPQFDPDWMRFVERLAERFPQAIGVEVWNEPNLVAEWWPRVDPARYTRILQEAYAAVKAVRPAMPVVSGGLLASPLAGSTAGGEGDVPFLAAIYADGGEPWMDAIGSHPYPEEYGADGPLRWDAAQMEHWLNRLRSVRAAAHASQPIWITEVGESTATQPGAPPPVSLSQQASDLVTMVRAVRSDSDVPVMIIETLEDQSPGYPDPDNGLLAGAGIFTDEFTPTPAACALSVLLRGSLKCPS
jgi:hypothetical protein